MKMDDNISFDRILTNIELIQFTCVITRPDRGEVEQDKKTKRVKHKSFTTRNQSHI